MSFEGITFMVFGAFSPRPKREIVAHLRSLGARVQTKMTVDADYLLLGAESTYYALRARSAGIPTLPAEVVDGLMSGMTREAFDEAVEGLAIPEPEVALEGADDLIEQIRPLLHSDGGLKWRKAVDLLDAATPEAQEAAVHYIQQAWRGRELDPKTHGVTSNWYSGDPNGRFLPDAWKRAALAGEDAPKFALVTTEVYDREGLVTAELMGLFACTSLRNVEILDLNGNKPGLGFFKGLAKAPHFDSLEYLLLESVKFKKSSAKALVEAPCLTNLRYMLCTASLDQACTDVLVRVPAALGLEGIALPPYVTYDVEHLDALFSPETFGTLRHVAFFNAILNRRYLLEKLEQAEAAGVELHVNLDGSWGPGVFPSIVEEEAGARFDGANGVKLTFKRTGG